MEAIVTAVSRSAEHNFSKQNQPSITLIEGVGVEGDAHAGKTIKHLYLLKKDPSRPNLRQVHLIQTELFDELLEKGFTVKAGELGENINTRGINLLGLPTGTRLSIGENVIIELTALRNPCVQIDTFQKGLLKAVIDRNEDGKVIRKTGVMGVVIAGGKVVPEDSIRIELPAEPHQPLEYVW
ncbi:MOSC domain-containing protein [Endozoicomonas elysicola]|uniref:Molybdenum cofactor biosysynthesis protein n=1 Tax=Endozoicomonas elysicola TaxID=305900 RepID=A0A081KCL7_9GAMM|nr:MOSC domain-containing protein [Endozoicomonas elysicola]KEI71893.1 molybdenum cofactor biosysynthesis protein [Endozoicomonas elysicola]